MTLSKSALNDLLDALRAGGDLDLDVFLTSRQRLRLD